MDVNDEDIVNLQQFTFSRKFNSENPINKKFSKINSSSPYFMPNNNEQNYIEYGQKQKRSNHFVRQNNHKMSNVYLDSSNSTNNNFKKSLYKNKNNINNINIISKKDNNSNHIVTNYNDIDNTNKNSYRYPSFSLIKKNEGRRKYRTPDKNINYNYFNLNFNYDSQYFQNIKNENPISHHYNIINYNDYIYRKRSNRKNRHYKTADKNLPIVIRF